MAKVEESIDVDVAITTAYNQWAKFESFPQFMDGVESITQLDDRRSHWKTNFGGAEREFDTEMVEQYPGERVAWKSTDGTTHAGVVTFDKLTANSTRVTAQLDWQPHGLIEKAGAMAGLDDYWVKATLKDFKAFIEKRGAATDS
jgi:uncharacterized membrane protein